jgi:hypothetical protein
MTILNYEPEERINNYKKKLQAGNCVVKFTKKDGTERTMYCTLNSDKITELGGYQQRSEYHKLPNIESQAVFDLEKNEWRAFRWDSIIYFTSSQDLDIASAL